MKKLIGLIIGIAFFGSLLQVTGILAQGNGEPGGGTNENGVGNNSNPTCATSTCEHPCTGNVCSCYNTKSSKGKTCGDPILNSALVNCEGQDLLLGLCDSWVSGIPKIYKCVNPLCPSDKTCGCYSLTPTITPTPTTNPFPGCFDPCGEGVQCDIGYQCTDINLGTGAPNYRCVADGNVCKAGAGIECWCAGITPTVTPTPTVAACDCNSAKSQGMVFSCPNVSAEQPGKAEGPISIGPIPACFAGSGFECWITGADGQRSKVDCSKFEAGYEPTPGWNELDGNRCRVYTGEISSNGTSCFCNSEVCCPRCQEPVEVDGVGSSCGPGCDFTAGGPNGAGCPCLGSGCNEFKPSDDSLAPTGGFGWDFGDWESGQEPVGDASCVNFNSAGVKVMTMSCSGGRKCTKEIVVGCSCSPSNLSPTPGADISPGWYKVKDDQLHKWDSIDDPIPSVVQAYDEDDVPPSQGGGDILNNNGGDAACDSNNPNDIRCLDHNQGGTVTTGGSTIELNGAPISYRQWHILNYLKSTTFSPSTFLEYAQARKRIISIDNIQDLVNIEPDAISVYTGDLTIDETPIGNSTVKAVLEDPERTPYVLIVQGDLTIDTDLNVPEPVTASPAPLAMMATGALKIHHFVQTLGGMYIGNTLDFAYDATYYSPYPLKIKGNIASMSTADPGKRRRTDNPEKPSIYVVFDSPTNVKLLDLLSFTTYFRSEITRPSNALTP